jgi:hypothetical protein
MEELIRQAFLHIMPLGPHVAEGHYDLVGPQGEIILPRCWEETIQPGWSITMHMWPLPESSQKPTKPTGPRAGSRQDFHPTLNPLAPKSFPSTASDTTKIGSEWVPPRGVPPPPRPNWPSQHPLASKPGRVPGSVDPSKPSVEKDKPPVKSINAGLLFGGADRKPDEKEQKETQVEKSSADTESLVSLSIVSDEDIEREAARKLIRKLVRSRKIYRVGKMNRGKYHLTYQITPKKEGLLLLNEYGRKLINEVMKAKI